LIAKTSTSFLSALLASAILLGASDSVVFSQNERNERQAAAQKSAEALFEDALLLSGSEQHETARMWLQQAMRLWAARREPGKAAKAALQMGERCKQTKEYQEALYYYNQALEVEALPDSLRANALNALALVYAELYETTLAENRFNKALELAGRLNDLPAQTLALTGLANLYHQQGDQAKALNYAARAHQLNRQKDAGAEAALLSLIGQIRLEDGLLQEATGPFEEALAIYEKASDSAGQSRVLSVLSSLSLQAGQKPVALEQAEQAVGLAEKLMARVATHADYTNLRDVRWRALLSRARAERALGEKERARKSYAAAIGDFVALWWGWAIYSATESCAIAFKEEAQAAYREYVDLLMEMGQVEQAYEMADSAKGRTILNRIAARRQSPTAINSEQATALAKRSQEAAGRRLQLLDPNLSRQQQASLQQAIDDAEAEIQEAQLKAEIEHSRAFMVWSEPATVKQLQEQTVRGQPALAEFLLGENHSFVWLFSHGQLFHATLPPRRQIEQAVGEYLKLLANPPGSLSIDRDLANVRARGAALFTTLFGTLAEQIEPGQRLIIVADGLLHYLPFEALLHGERYLIQDHEIIYNPSASILSLWQDAAAHHSTGGEPLELLAIGDPVFEPATRSVGAKKQTMFSSTRRPQPLASRGLPFATLPRTRDEVEYIAGLFPADRRKVLLGRQSTEAAFKRERLGHYRRLHFATHSQIDEKTPWRSAVVLTPDEAEDGLLDVNEISRLDLDCDLVVVSACQTGRGQLLSGEGIVGLSRAFLCAGARTVIVSLWNVSDNSTSQLMKDFYTKLIGGLGNAAALREAKLRMLGSNKVTRHPHYWSSFVMVGKP
jgi:CHAT domain-containing protein